jgi:hypothetical protein
VSFAVSKPIVSTAKASGPSTAVAISASRRSSAVVVGHTPKQLV